VADRRPVAEVEMTTPDPAFWHRQRVFLTGHTGFKGGWLAVWLHMLGAEIFGYALAPDTTPALFEKARIGGLLHGEIADIDDLPQLSAAISAFRPTVVIHMAAQPLVRRSYAEPRETFATNLLGTVNLLEAVRATPGIRAAFVVTTDKCYENLEHGRPYRESDRLGGRDPYSASKACAELATQSYFWSFFKESGCGLATGRAGNVIGGGDWSVDRLVPDLMRAFHAGQPAVLRNPAATRPWQHVLEPLNGYLLAIERIWDAPADAPVAWNFGPDLGGNQSVGDVAAAAAREWGSGAEIVVQRNPNAPHEATLLSVDSGKARTELSWAPRWSFDNAIQRTVSWYRDVYHGADARLLCQQQIENFATGSVRVPEGTGRP
jgi:CDP-glucose 4,6-dehydratase